MWNFLSCLSEKSLNNLKNISIALNEQDAGKLGASPEDIAISRSIGFHPMDVRALRLFTLEHNYLLVFRCPKLDSRAFIGALPPKMMVIKEKTNEFGIVSTMKKTPEGELVDRWFVSDYDLMCLYRLSSNGAAEKKVFCSGVDVNNPRSPLPADASAFIRMLNARLINKLQHGAQDDFKSKNNRGVKMSEDRYVAALLGEIRPLGDGHSTRAFYQQYRLDWPYDDTGEYRLG